MCEVPPSFWRHLTHQRSHAVRACRAVLPCCPCRAAVPLPPSLWRHLTHQRSFNSVVVAAVGPPTAARCVRCRHLFGGTSHINPVIIGGAMCEVPPSFWRHLTHQRSRAVRACRAVLPCCPCRAAVPLPLSLWRHLTHQRSFNLFGGTSHINAVIIGGAMCEVPPSLCRHLTHQRSHNRRRDV